MYFQKDIINLTEIFFFGVLKVTDKKRRIWIRKSVERIRVSETFTKMSRIHSHCCLGRRSGGPDPNPYLNPYVRFTDTQHCFLGRRSGGPVPAGGEGGWWDGGDGGVRGRHPLRLPAGARGERL